jgi:DNA polymerase/3'-5' exonuclease PolX
MSSSTRQYAREEVLPSYWQLWEALIPACQKCGYAGSLRRRTPTVSDIEMVVLPFFDSRDSLFETGEQAETYSQMSAVLDALLASGVLVWDEAVKRRGDWYKRYRLPALGIGLDLFVARPNNFGYIQALRTGSAEFSHALVTATHQGGLRPAHLRCKNGFVWKQRTSGELAITEAVPMPSEEALFTAWGLPDISPRDRDANMVAELRRYGGLYPVPAYASQQKGAH